jgi:hypothetical protein
MPTKTKKAKIDPKLAKAMQKIEKNYAKRVKKYDSLLTLREVLGRVKNKFNLIVYEGQRYWRSELATKGDWRFNITKYELQFIEGLCYDFTVDVSFPLGQPVKVGKKSIRLVEDDVEIRLLNVVEVNL